MKGENIASLNTFIRFNEMNFEFQIDDKRKEKIQSFVDTLGNYELENTYNPYTNDKIARNNLIKYFEMHENSCSKILLVGEAPGHHGCKRSGIPFTSGELIAKSPIFRNIRNNYDFLSIEKFSETTSTIFYSVFEKHPQVYPHILMWNAFPFHPYKKDEPNSNRKPKGDEIKIGKKILDDLCGLFEIKYFVPIGNVAEALLKKMEIKSLKKIRHPSYGGKSEFLLNMEKLIAQYF